LASLSLVSAKHNDTLVDDVNALVNNFIRNVLQKWMTALLAEAELSKPAPPEDACPA
jgi:hypothetical protein